MGKKEKPEQAPRLAKRSLNKKSKIKIGRAIVEKRERLETASERVAARKKGKRQKVLRVILVIIGFSLIVGTIVAIVKNVISGEEGGGLTETIVLPYEPTIELVDEAAGNHKISSRMREYVGQAESDFRDLGYTPLRAVIPAGAIREVDFYLSGWNGRIKLTIDRETAVSVEDADRMLRYLQGIGVSEFEYIDVRVEGKGYWK
ncbi:MAG: hypothetical protein K6G36_02965 [Candidatus Saccharibacteria bacterium]|nr:hypothetical protein [Candidatus Saccharibacteria bacterium]